MPVSSAQGRFESASQHQQRQQQQYVESKSSFGNFWDKIQEVVLVLDREELTKHGLGGFYRDDRALTFFRNLPDTSKILKIVFTGVKSTSVPIRKQLMLPRQQVSAVTDADQDPDPIASSPPLQLTDVNASSQTSYEQQIDQVRNVVEKIGESLATIPATCKPEVSAELNGGMIFTSSGMRSGAALQKGER
ncbi:hypothetical protein I316_00476 [Kwoniella heveanensis BCC8398]|uniref:Uncharacterized protein n=1 Tax=Kwoniella heveanensis BCC8398 TaxID=1296120 RepID=A0A1B9H265_9TREE|nr:hypothetical protein I316_00476 [Kwoniella heveanensis BCC8398]